MLSEDHRNKYEQILAQVKENSANIFTQEDYSKHLNISRRKFSDFINLKLYDLELLIQYACINGYIFELSIREKVGVLD